MSKLNQGKYNDASIIFLHIPKSAGSTLNTVINRQYRKEFIFSIYGFERSEREVKTAEQFKALPETRRRNIKLLRGHIGFGLHKYLVQPSIYITLLRDPIKRVLSQYYYILRQPEHPLYKELKTNNMSLQDYVISGIDPNVNNGQTKALAGVKATTIKFGEVPITLLEDAQKNIQEHFAVVGLTEKFDESLILLQKVLGWKSLFYTKKNVAKNQQSKDISAADMTLIQQYNELDIELYNFAEKYVENKMNQYKDSFQKDLTAFKVLNQQYGYIRSISHSIRDRIKSLSHK
ncbi:sulfotransferase family 2 domain-containing protein [Gloeocapsopsis crepidinum LEGE 06123]|uniref:Sulfotransferase family 2 domain-containing protein n=1 Tax=Gloeocapsopsis crepidinum LEGE 06123 TaxID=588587 RepID=A0ABR9UQK1_9CHRO|nr:sulfotransferase family 2 domain-containing protein [Gloeocapsopsis crepidinum]MBE9190340.1 sulfotransferase family 2 domain-containing protein [Gloeocapsopsis crepidinum LEGE 06123]